MYKWLSRFWLTRRYISEVRHMYETIKPAGGEQLEKQVLYLIIRSFVITAVIFAAALLSGRSNGYTWLILLSMSVIINRQLVLDRLKKEEYRLLKQLEKYIGDVRHFYHAGGMIEEAIYDSLEEAPYEIALHMQCIYEILISEEEEKVEQYKETAPNKYFVTFLALCFLTIRYGDSRKTDGSLFLTNLNHLKTEIQIELLKRDKTAHIFQGLLTMALIPVFTLKLIEGWGISNLPELRNYYNGGYGIKVTMLIFAVTILAYQVVTRLREDYRYLNTRSPILERIADFPPVEKALWTWCNRNPGKVYQIHKQLKQSGEKRTVNQYMAQRGCLFLGGYFFCSILLLHGDILEKEVLFTIKNWYYPLICLMAGWVLSIAPWLLLKLKGIFIYAAMEDEVMQYHTILLMLVHIKQMNVETILCWLENFSCIFRESIEACVDHFSYDNEAALEKLKTEETFPPLLYLIENLEASDRVGIEAAFDEMVSQQKYYEEKRKQDNEIMISNKGVTAKIIAYVPLMLTLGLYLILPFILESLNQLGGYLEQMGGAGRF